MVVHWNARDLGSLFTMDTNLNKEFAYFGWCRYTQMGNS